MTTTLERLCRMLVAAALFMASVPAPIAAETAVPPDAGIADARALLNGGRPDAALEVLRTLARSHPGRMDIRFLASLAAIEAARMPGVAEADREALLDEAIATLRAILVDAPGLVRVRLELARAFFYKEEDSLARDHFERVLAGKPPAPVVANVQLFLRQIRARRRWTMYLGAALLPDSNIGGSSDEAIIYIFDLPFRRDNADELTTSGVGASLWTGGEYQHPLGDRLRLRTGADLARREYAGREFDDTYVSVHAGPRWLVDPRTEMSLLASARRRWAGTSIDHDAVGARIEARRRLTRRATGNARASWYQRDYRQDRDYLDGPVTDASLGGTWTISPTMQADAAVGYAKERPERERDRNNSRWLRAGLTVALPRGFNVGGSGQLRWTNYKGDWFFTGDDSPREDRIGTLSLALHKRDFTLFGFSPQVVVTREVRSTNAQLHDYQRTRGEIRLVRQF